MILYGTVLLTASEVAVSPAGRFVSALQTGREESRRRLATARFSEERASPTGAAAR